MGAIIGLVAGGRALLFRIPAFKRTLSVNTLERKRKWRELGHKYNHRINVSQKIGLVTNLAFFFLVLPFIVSLQPTSIARTLLDAVLVLMVYDFFYYLTHRFIFHGKG